MTSRIETKEPAATAGAATPRTVRVEVTAEDIAAAGWTGGGCPHYRAISRALGQSDIWVERTRVLRNGPYPQPVIAELPNAAVDWIGVYDRDMNIDRIPRVAPIQYDLALTSSTPEKP